MLVSEVVVLRWGLLKRANCLRARSLCCGENFLKRACLLGREEISADERGCRATAGVCLREHVCWGGKRFMLTSEVVVLRWGLFKREHCLKARSLCHGENFSKRACLLGREVVAPRRKFIEENALLVSNLDV